MHETDFPRRFTRVNISHKALLPVFAPARRHVLPAVLLFVSSLSSLSIRSQNSFLPYSDRYRPDRLRTVVITEAVSAAAISTGLYFLWYRKHPRSRFHFFNDNAEWLQVDKIGHATTAYNVGAFQYDLMRWCGVKNDVSVLAGSLTAIGYLSIVEILDGFSSKWGFSKGDMLANLIGTALFAGQQLGWQQQRVALKFSYHPTLFPQYYPAELGSNWISRLLKDYNGQTYWLSFNVAPFLPTHTDFPPWLNLNFGYGAEGMIGARENPALINGHPVPAFRRFRQFYFSPDIDALRIDSRSRFFNSGASLTRFAKWPAPALEWNPRDDFRFHFLYY